MTAIVLFKYSITTNHRKSEPPHQDTENDLRCVLSSDKPNRAQAIHCHRPSFDSRTFPPFSVGCIAAGDWSAVLVSLYLQEPSL